METLLETPPKTPDQRYILDLTELTQENGERLEERLRQCGGLIRIFVHPLYEKWRHGNWYRDKSEYIQLVRIEEALIRLLSMSEEDAPPILILEEEAHEPTFERWLAREYQEGTRTKPYFIRTLPDNPTPAIVGESEADIWTRFRKLLKILGVKKILLGGLRLEVDSTKKDWTGKGPWVARCVGIALSYLAKEKGGEFEVELSGLIDPPFERRNYLSCIGKVR